MGVISHTQLCFSVAAFQSLLSHGRTGTLLRVATLEFPHLRIVNCAIYAVDASKCTEFGI